MQWSNVRLSDIRELAQVLQSVVTSIALIVGGIWFLQKRQKFPRASIEHRISHRIVPNHGLLLSVDVTVSNKGNVLLSLKNGEIHVKQILPPQAALFRLIHEETNSADQVPELKNWRYIVSREEKWKSGKLEIEPGESHQFYHHFLIPSDVQTVLVESFFQNVRKPRRQLYWRLANIYDIKTP